MGKHSSTRFDESKKCCSTNYRDKNELRVPYCNVVVCVGVGKGGGGGRAYDVTPDLTHDCCGSTGERRANVIAVLRTSDEER